MSFFEKAGKMAIGSRLRMLLELITEDAKQIYKLYDTNLEPHWFPVFYVLSQGSPKAVTSIAEEIGQSHPAVIKTVRQMAKKGLVTEQKDTRDGRKNILSLSKKGKEVASKIESQYKDLTCAVEEVAAQTNHDLWKAMEEWEFLLQQKSLFKRVQEQKKQRESADVQIVDYRPKYQAAFKALNEEWISTYFKMEEPDYKSLENPKSYILDKGGCILVALYNGESVGVCALIKGNESDYDFELAKMAVSPKARGKNIGWLLGRAAIEKAKSLGAKKLYLESNTILKPAINLYQKLGFQKVTGRSTPYERCNIQMELDLNG